MKRIFLISIVLLVGTSSNNVVASNKNVSQFVEAYGPTKVVTIRPPYGYSQGPISVRLSRSEIVAVQQMQLIADKWAPEAAIHAPVKWYIEPGVENSPTLLLAKKAFTAAQFLLRRPQTTDFSETSIVIGRTQKFLKKTVSEHNCYPNLDFLKGNYLMGATICRRRVIVINLTGYFFVKSPNDLGVAAFEKIAEPEMSKTFYLNADRNLASLAHEWTHRVRKLPSENPIAANEPVWLSEGMAEIVGGLALVKSSQGRKTYLDFHVVRLRKFSNIQKTCLKSLTEYRSRSTNVSGCEYLRGAAAVEFLLSRFGGIPNVNRLYDDADLTGDFVRSFSNVYGMSLRSFEIRADKYMAFMRQADRSRIG